MLGAVFETPHQTVVALSTVRTLLRAALSKQLCAKLRAAASETLGTSGEWPASLDLDEEDLKKLREV